MEFPGSLSNQIYSYTHTHTSRYRYIFQSVWRVDRVASIFIRAIHTLRKNIDPNVWFHSQVLSLLIIGVFALLLWTTYEVSKRVFRALVPGHWKKSQRERWHCLIAACVWFYDCYNEPAYVRRVISFRHLHLVYSISSVQFFKLNPIICFLLWRFTVNLPLDAD